MKKIYFLLLIGFAFTTLGYGQTVTLDSQNYDDQTTWGTQSISSPPASVSWGEMSNLSGVGTIPSQTGTLISGDFFGVRNPSQAAIQNLEFIMSDVDIEGYHDIKIQFDYEYHAHNTNRVPEITYQVFANSLGTAVTLPPETFIGRSTVTNKDGIGSISIDIPDDTYINVSIKISIVYPATTGGNDNMSTFVLGLDNFRVISENSFDGYVLEDNTWTDPDGGNTAPDNNSGASNALIVNGTYTISSNVELNNVFTEAGAGITINPTGSLTTNDITTANNLILNSTASPNEFATLIVSGTVTGNATYNRVVNITGENDLISAPVTGQTFGNFADANTNLANANGSTVIKKFGPWLRESGSYISLSSATGSADRNIILQPTVGYRAATTDDGTLSFTGTVNTTGFSTNLSYNSTTASSQWNLIGNPYTAYISVADFLNTNPDTNFQTGKKAVYGYDGNASDGWLVYNALSGVNMTPGQGFFVAVPPSAENTAVTMILDPSMIEAGATDGDFINGRTADLHKTHFKLALKTGETKRHTTDIYFVDDATLGLDNGYDATIYGNNSSGFTMFTQLVETNPNFKIAIQALPNSELGTGIAIPLGIIAPKGEQITLNITESTLNEGATVYLEDTKTNTWTLLSDKPYTFTTDTKLSGLGRFVLHTTDASRLSIVDNTLDQLQIFTGEQSIKLKGQLDKNTILAVYDIQGRQMNKAVLNTTVSEYTLSTRGFSSGIYIVSIKGSNGNSFSKRVILK